MIPKSYYFYPHGYETSHVFAFATINVDSYVLNTESNKYNLLIESTLRIANP